MNEDELNKKQIRTNRWVALIGGLVVVGGFAFAIVKDNDWWALGASALIGIFVYYLTWDDAQRSKKWGGGLVSAASVFFIYMAIRFIVASDF